MQKLVITSGRCMEIHYGEKDNCEWEYGLYQTKRASIEVFDIDTNELLAKYTIDDDFEPTVNEEPIDWALDCWGDYFMGYNAEFSIIEEEIDIKKLRFEWETWLLPKGIKEEMLRMYYDDDCYCWDVSDWGPGVGKEWENGEYIEGEED